MNAEMIEKIEAYLEGQISREELEQEAEEAGISNLEEEIQWLRDAQTAVEAAGLRKQLNEALPLPKVKETKVRRLRPLRAALAIAASLLILVLAYFGLNRDVPPTLYSKYEYVDPGLPVLMSQSEDYLLYDALTYYSEGNYAAAAEKLRQIQPQYPNSDTLAYYLGASLLYEGKPEEARQQFQRVLQMEDSNFRQRAEWLMVLSALREDEQAEAQRLVQNILNKPGHEFYEEAQSLQNDLEE